jgi:ATP sulfurylase
VLGSFSTFSRYSGPREAVFTALCRKNMGCSHFIVGRDHTGVGDFYPPDAVRKRFDALPELGITPVFFDAIGYDAETGTYRSSAEATRIQSISGTQVRDALQKGEQLPEWFMRTEIQELLAQMLATGQPIFQSEENGKLD